MIYLIPLPPNRLDRRNRACGWRHLALEKVGRESLKLLCAKMEKLPISAVVASDTDESAAQFVAAQLHAQPRTDFGFRRFNVGRHHGAPLDRVERILADLVKKWEKNPDVPIRGGDSLTSFKRRFDKAIDKLLEQENVAFIADEQTMRYIRERKPEALIRNGNRIAMDRVYVVRKNAGTA